MYPIVYKEQLNDTVEKMIIKAPFVSRKCEPGQFIILCVDEEGERIPLTIQDYNREDETVSIVYQIVGYSTKKLSEKQVGDTIAHFVGPLGRESISHGHKRVLGIGGGVGAAPLYPQLKKLAQQGIPCDAILGGRDEQLVILEDDFKALTENVYITTDDGSRGQKGFVTDTLNQLLQKGHVYDEIIAIGPLPMMKAVVAITKPLGIPTQVSMNPIMIDGTGMCGGCRVTIDGKVQFACVDGPDFDGFKVDFDEALRRQGMYKKHEEHLCNLYKEATHVQ